MIAAGGDGDAFAAGAGPLVHIARRNPDLTYLIMDNGCYGLTRGQASPTAQRKGMAEENGAGQPINPLAFLITAGATFVAQGYSEDPQSLTRLIGEALNHRGFAVINVISPCPVFNPQRVTESNREGIESIDPASHRAHDRFEALRLAMAPNRKLRVGIFYREERRAPGGEPRDRVRQDFDDVQARLEDIMDLMRP